MILQIKILQAAFFKLKIICWELRHILWSLIAGSVNMKPDVEIAEDYQCDQTVVAFKWSGRGVKIVQEKYPNKRKFPKNTFVFLQPGAEDKKNAESLS